MCLTDLHSFTKFKQVCLKNSLRLEERIKEAWCDKDSATQVCGAPDAQLLTNNIDTEIDNTTVAINNKNVENISVKEELCEESTYNQEYNSVVKVKCILDNNVNCSTASETSDPKFEVIYVKEEVLENSSTDTEDCVDVEGNKSNEE